MSGNCSSGDKAGARVQGAMLHAPCSSAGSGGLFRAHPETNRYLGVPYRYPHIHTHTEEEKLWSATSVLAQVFEAEGQMVTGK